MKPSHFSNQLLLVFSEKKKLNTITLAWRNSVFAKKTLIFSKTVD